MRSLRVAIGFARLAVWSALAAVTGCTLVSGWSDLQDGARSTDAGSGANAPTDSGASSGGQPGSGADSGAQGDSAAAGNDAGGADASAVLLTVACGTVRCPEGEGCCVAILGESFTCAASAQSCAPPGAFETCSDSSQCIVTLGHTAQCCDNGSSGVPGVACRTSCAGTGNIVCDPTLLLPTCPTGMTCKANVEFGYDTCQ